MQIPAHLNKSYGFIIHLMDLEMAAVINRRFAEKGGDITPEHWLVLEKISQKPGLHQSELAKQVCKNRHNMTRIITVLEERGYVKRLPDQEDKRLLRVFLTDPGQAVRDKMTPVVADFRARMLKGIDQGALETMHKTHFQILKNLGFQFSEQT